MIFLFLKRIILYVPRSFLLSELSSDIYLQSYSAIKNKFQVKNEKLSYALDISLSNYINQYVDKKMRVKLDKNSILKGIKDIIFSDIKLRHQDISLIIKELSEKLKSATKIQFEKI